MEAVLGLIARLSEQRRELIHGHARPYLEADEEIVMWVRARRVEARGEGFVFLTDRRAVIAWTGRNDGDASVAWGEIITWGVDRSERWGPVLGIETGDGIHMAQILARTHRMAQDARGFVARFAQLAPKPERPFEVEGRVGSFEHLPEVEVARVKRSPWELARRIAVTVLGVTLIVLGIAIIPLPGPWTFLINIAGLAILASEYDWAKDLLTWTRRKFEEAKKRIAQRRARKSRD